MQFDDFLSLGEIPSHLNVLFFYFMRTIIAGTVVIAHSCYISHYLCVYRLCASEENRGKAPGKFPIW